MKTLREKTELLIKRMRADSLVDFMRASDREMVIDEITEFVLLQSNQKAEAKLINIDLDETFDKWFNAPSNKEDRVYSARYFLEYLKQNYPILKVDKQREAITYLKWYLENPEVEYCVDGIRYKGNIVDEETLYQSFLNK